jgi:hypothetical protein
MTYLLALLAPINEPRSDSKAASPLINVRIGKLNALIERKRTVHSLKAQGLVLRPREQEGEAEGRERRCVGFKGIQGGFEG